MSRMGTMGIVAIALFASPKANAQALTAEAALANYAALTAVRATPACARDADPDEIVICGRDESPRQRLPLPNDRGPRAWARTATGDVSGAAGAGAVSCIGCGVFVGVNIPKSIGLITKGVSTIIDPDD